MSDDPPPIMRKNVGRGTDPMTLKEGDIDPEFGRRIAHIVIRRPTYIVYLDDGLTTWWWFTTDQPTNPEYDDPLNQVAILESISVEDLPAAIRLKFRRLVAEGLVREINKNTKAALSIFAEAKRYITARRGELARRWLLTGCFVALVLAVFGLILSAGWFGHHGSDLGAAVFCGALGSALSLMARTGSLGLDPDTGRGLHFLEAAARFTIGLLAGGVACLASHAGMLPKIMSSGSSEAWLMLAAIAAGYSERLVPTIVGRVESQASSPGTST